MIKMSLKKELFVLFLAALLCLTAWAALAEDPVEVEITVSYGQTAARSMLQMINDFRTGEDAWYWDTDNQTPIYCEDLKPLTYDYTLEIAAKQRAAEIAIYFSHTRPNNTKCFTVFPSNCYSAGENIAAGYTTANAAFIGWREDDENYAGQGHRRNMLSEDFNCIGIGHVVYNGKHYWTQALGYRASPNTTDSQGATNGSKIVVIPVAPEMVNAVSAKDITLEYGQSTECPDIYFDMKTAGGLTQTNIHFIPNDEADLPVWTVSDSSKLKIEDTFIVALNAGKTTMYASAFGKAVMSNVTITPRNLSNAEISLSDTSMPYNGSAQKPDVTVQDGETVLTEDKDYTVTWSSNTNAGTAKVTATGKDNYTGTLSASFKIKQVPLTITANDKTIVYGKSPSNDGVTYEGFVGGETEAALGGTLKYEYSYSKFGNVGTYTITPSGLTSGNYKIEFVKGTLTVEQKEAGITWGETDLYYNGKTQAPKATVTGTVNNDVIKAKIEGAEKYPGSYTATVTELTGSKAGNYILTGELSIDYVIHKGIPTVTAPTPIKNLVYTGEPQALVKAGSTSGGTLLYCLAENGDYTEDIPVATEVGTYTIWYRVDGGDYYEDVDPKSVENKIKKKIPTVTPPTPIKDLVYNGEPQALVKAGSTTGGILKYCLSKNGDYSEEIPVGVEVGSYTIWYRVDGDDNYEDVDPKSVKTKIHPVTVTEVTVKGGIYSLDLEKKTAVFTGAADPNAETLTIAKTVKANETSYKVTEIAASACKGMAILTQVDLGKGVKTIGKNAFSSCTALKTVKGGTAVVAIKDSAFSGCKALTTFPDMSKLQTIGASAFKKCMKLKAFTLGAKVKSIGKNAFNGCKKLKKITVKTTKLTESNVKTGAFKNIYKKATFTCPSGKADAYKKLFVKRGAPKTCKFK